LIRKTTGEITNTPSKKIQPVEIYDLFLISHSKTDSYAKIAWFFANVAVQYVM
jgi:hypothetical protein